MQARGKRAIDQAQAARELGGHHHASAHALAVQPGAIAHAGLDGVAKGVAKVQDGAQARFTLVLAHHPGFDLTAAAHGVGQRSAIARQQGIHVRLQPVHEGHVGNRPVFDDFCQPGAEFARCQGVERGQVTHHQLGLVESANHVFAQRVVDGSFAAHRRIDLGQQRGRHLHKRHAAHVTGGGKAGHVAYHATAQGKQHGFAVTAMLQQGIKNQVQGLPGFVLLAIGQHHGVHLGVLARQRALQCLRVQGRHHGVGHDERRHSLGQMRIQRGGWQQIGTNHDGVAALGQVDLHALRSGDGVGMCHGSESAKKGQN